MLFILLVQSSLCIVLLKISNQFNLTARDCCDDHCQHTPVRMVGGNSPTAVLGRELGAGVRGGVGSQGKRLRTATRPSMAENRTTMSMVGDPGRRGEEHGQA